MKKAKEVWEINQYENLSVDDIYKKGIFDTGFDFNKGFDALKTKDKNGQWISFAGRDWKTFDFNDGLDALIEKDKTGYYIYMAGKDWKTFDFKKGMKVLEKIGGEYLEKAKKDWPKSYPEKLKDVKDKYDENIIPGKRKKLKK